MHEISYWSLVGWLGIFLFGMLVFEETISHLGKWFLKKVLEKNTNTRIKSVITGIVQTCIFQSSTIVTMMTLWFVGAGVIGLSNALWVVVWANIGTTLTPWLVTFFGFKVDIESFALPMIGIWWIATIIFAKSEKVMNVAKFLIGFGLLFLWLSYMKEAVDVIAQSVSLESYSHFSIWWYVLIGAIITTAMQTSTGATIITLTALNANLITLDMALGIVIWANLWSAISTTVIWLLSSSPTQIQKKKVALSHLIFNISTTIIVTLAYPWIKAGLLHLVDDTNNNILILSMFHTTFNIILAVIWTPLLWVLLKVLAKLIPQKASELHLAIDHINTALPEEVLHALEKDTELLLGKVWQYNRHVMYLDHLPHYPQKTHEDYVTIKEIEERLLTYIVKLHKTWFTEEQAHKVHLFNDIIVQAITSSKYLKDIQHHIINIKDESISHTLIWDSLHFFQEMVEKTSQSIIAINTNDTVDNNTASLKLTIESLHSNDDHYLETLTTQRDEKEIAAINIAEIIRTNRYVLLSCEALLVGHIAYLGK